MRPLHRMSRGKNPRRSVGPRLLAGLAVFALAGFSGCGKAPGPPPSPAPSATPSSRPPGPAPARSHPAVAKLQTRIAALPVVARSAWQTAPFSVRFVSTQVGWALTGGLPDSVGWITWTRDGGRQWHAVAFPGITWDALRVSNAQTITAVGHRGPAFVAAHTTDGGARWLLTTAAHPPFGSGIRAIGRLDGHLLVLDAAGHLWAATSTAWRAIPTPHQAPIRAFHVHGTTLAAILGRQELVITPNAGRSWSIRWTAPAGDRLVALAPQGTAWWILGQAVQGATTTNTIWVASPDAPVTRRFTASGPTARAWTGLQMTTATTGWAWGGQCADIRGPCAMQLYQTHDGGRRWPLRTLPRIRHPYPNPSVPPAVLRGFRPAGFWGPTHGVIALGLLPPHLAVPGLWDTADGGSLWHRQP